MAATTMKPHVAASLHSLIGAIPGCALDRRIRGSGSSTMGASTMRHILIVDGWSPSLQECRMQWQVALSSSLDPKEQLQEALSQIDGEIAVQKDRAAAGLALSQPVPFEISSMHPTDIGHLHADASLIATLLDEDRHPNAGSYGCATRLDRIAHIVNEIHSEGRDYSGGRILMGRNARILEQSGRRVVEFHHDIRHPSRDDINGIAKITGQSIVINGATLPDTILAAAPGRRVGEIAQLNSTVDARRIRSVRQKAERLTITMEPAPVKLESLMLLTVDGAKAELQRIIGL